MSGEHVNKSILSDSIIEDQKKARTNHMEYLPDMEVIDSDIMDRVLEAASSYDQSAYTEADVRRALAHSSRTPADFAALLSPAALPFIEEIAQAAQRVTRKHFGNSIANCAMQFYPVSVNNLIWGNYQIYPSDTSCKMTKRMV